MNRSSFAFFVALLLHLFILLIFWILGTTLSQIKKPKIQEEKRMRVSLKELPKPIKIVPPTVKGSQLKEIIKKTPIKYEKKIKPKTPKLNPQPKVKVKVKPKPKSVQKVKVKALPKKEVFVPIKKEIKKVLEVKPKKEITKEAPMDWLLEDKVIDEKPKTHEEYTMGTSSGKNIKELYGSTFTKLSHGQQKYIIDNQEIMRKITQKILTRQASVSDLRGLNVDKSNVIEFYLHPNGDMSDFKFLNKSGYFILDEITRVTIEYAYSKYPRPKEKTLIRYNVFYNLRSY